MAIDLMRVAAALNAYPWTTGAIASGEEGTPRYCAVGLLLRYAGVPYEQLACAPPSLEPWWEQYGELLRFEYGIRNLRILSAIVIANDTAPSQEAAIERVQRLLGGASDPESNRLRRLAGLPPVASRGTPTHRDSAEDDGGGSLASLR